MGYTLVGRSWKTSAEFQKFLKKQDLSWVKGITMHHTAYPSLAMRPDGLTDQHIKNIANYYKNELGWSAGPHLFIDDHRIMGMSSLEAPGTHAKSFNRSHIGIEVLGNYDSEDPNAGRGRICWYHAEIAVRAILEKTGLKVQAVNGHRDDPKTSKTCPGTKVDLNEFRNGIFNSTVPPQSPPESPGLSEEEINRIADAIIWQAMKLKQPDPDAEEIEKAIEWQLAKL